MQSVEHHIWQAHTAHEAKEALRVRLSFEEYQQDFAFTDEELRHRSILDVGAGNGSFVEYVRTQKGNEHAFAIDTEYVSQASHYTTGSILAIPYPDHVFDNVISRNVIHALMLQKEKDSVPQAIRELVRVTKNGGVAQYAIHNPHLIRQRIQDSDGLSHNQKEIILARFLENQKAEVKTLQKLEELGHKIEISLKDNRRVVSITLRAVQ